MNKHLLVRADFVVGRRLGGGRPAFRRWRRILADALPRLLGCAERCEKAERVCLRKGEGEGRYVGWVRIPVQRWPGRERFRQLKARLRARLEDGLRPLGGELIKFGVRRQRRKPERVPVALAPEALTAA